MAEDLMWLPGMLGVTPVGGALGFAYRVIEVDYKGHPVLWWLVAPSPHTPHLESGPFSNWPSDATPDLDDPVTFGYLSSRQ